MKTTFTGAKISLRIAYHLWSKPQSLDEVFNLVKEYRDVIEEVAFFSSFTHAVLPLDELRRRAAALSPVVARFKTLGIPIGINHLCTIGQVDENLAHTVREPWQFLVDISGKVSPSCLCAADPKVKEYIRATYQALAEAKPDFFWIDDDVRMEGHPTEVSLACFCPHCMEQFSQQTGRPWTRETLRGAFNTGERAERYALRKAWLEHNRDYINEIISLVRQGIDRVNADIPLGFMQCEMPYSGCAEDRWYQTMAGPRNLKVHWRPGGGFWDDRAPQDMLSKIHD